VLFYRSEDLAIHQFFAGGGQVHEAQILHVLETLRGSDDTITQHELLERTGLSQSKLETVLTRLEDAGVLEIRPAGEVARTHRVANPEQITTLVLNEEKHRRVTERSRIDMMRGYAELLRCRREYILNYFGEAYAAPCGNCDNDNRDRGKVEPASDHAAPFALGSRVVHAAFGPGVVELTKEMR
jgi:ATP-dependent DNA helicase RecQ